MAHSSETIDPRLLQLLSQIPSLGGITAENIHVEELSPKELTEYMTDLQACQYVQRRQYNDNLYYRTIAGSNWLLDHARYEQTTKLNITMVRLTWGIWVLTVTMLAVSIVSVACTVLR